MQVGTTKDQGLYNKPSAAVHPEALAAGTLPQYNTMDSTIRGSNPGRRNKFISSSEHPDGVWGPTQPLI